MRVAITISPHKIFDYYKYSLKIGAINLFKCFCNIENIARAIDIFGVVLALKSL